MKFIADCMLGGLAKWLRLLGYDTTYFRKAEDPELARIALREDRILLTKDNELAGRKILSGRTLLIESQDTTQQLRQVIEHLNLDTNSTAMFTRCIVCNEPTEEVTKESVHYKVPSYVYKTQQNFRQCPSCGRIYWRGTHIDHIIDALARNHESTD